MGSMLRDIVMALVGEIDKFILWEFVHNILYVENSIAPNIYLRDTFSFTPLYNVVFGAGISLLILLFLKKGFEIYILWVDGNPEESPADLLLNFAKAMIIAISFPVIYSWIATMAEQFAAGLFAAVNDGYQTLSFPNAVDLVGVLLSLVFVICTLVLLVQFLLRGIELLILRLGVPLACASLLQKDKGLFNAYMTKFSQSIFTIITQATLAKLGFGMIIGGHYLWAIACMTMALKTPRLLQEFLVPPVNMPSIFTVRAVAKTFMPKFGR
jgi:hypothetical protein